MFSAHEVGGIPEVPDPESPAVIEKYVYRTSKNSNSNIGGIRRKFESTVV